MSISSHVSDDGKTITIKVDGRFDFSVHRDFRSAYSQLEPAQSNYVIDLTRTEYMDSAALGMLLVLRERAGNDPSKVKLVGCKPEIQQILDISRFDQLFTIV